MNTLGKFCTTVMAFAVMTGLSSHARADGHEGMNVPTIKSSALMTGTPASAQSRATADFPEATLPVSPTEIIRRRPETTGGQHEVAAAGRVHEGRVDVLHVVADRGRRDELVTPPRLSETSAPSSGSIAREPTSSVLPADDDSVN